MDTTLTKWGNSLAVRIPKAFTEQIGVKDGDKLFLSIKDDKILLSPNSLSLEDMVSRINKKNIHSETFVDNQLGNEFW